MYVWILDIIDTVDLSQVILDLQYVYVLLALEDDLRHPYFGINDEHVGCLLCKQVELVAYVEALQLDVIGSLHFGLGLLLLFLFDFLVLLLLLLIFLLQGPDLLLQVLNLLLHRLDLLQLVLLLLLLLLLVDLLFCGHHCILVGH